jgi:DNA polymerase-1
MAVLEFSYLISFTLAAFDYSQLEMRILTHMSKDPILIEFFKNGQDIHKLIAGRWLNKPPEKISSQEREQAKRKHKVL